MKKFLQLLRREDDGATAVEYAVMLALIIVFCVGAVRYFGQTTADSFTDTSNQINSFFTGS